MVSPTTSQPESHVALAPVANVDLPKPPAKTTTPDHPSCSSSSSSSSSTTAEINGHVSENKDAGEINKKEPEPENLTNEIMDKENDSDKKDDNRKTSENYRNENDTKEDTGTKSEISHNNILTDSNTSQKDNIPSTTSKSDSKLSSPPSPIPSPTFSTTSSFNSASDQSSTTPNPTSPKNFTSAPIPTVNVWAMRKAAMNAKAKKEEKEKEKEKEKEREGKDKEGDGDHRKAGENIRKDGDRNCKENGIVNEFADETKRFTKKNSKKSKPAPILPPLEDQSSWPAPAEVLIKDKAKEASELAEKKNDTGKKEEGSSPKRGKGKWIPIPATITHTTPLPTHHHGYKHRRRSEDTITLSHNRRDRYSQYDDVNGRDGREGRWDKEGKEGRGWDREGRRGRGGEGGESSGRENGRENGREGNNGEGNGNGHGHGTTTGHRRRASVPPSASGQYARRYLHNSDGNGQVSGHANNNMYRGRRTGRGRSYGSRGPPRSASALYSPGYPQTYSVFPNAKMPVVIDVDLLKYYILQQVEYYFSVENLCKDIFLRTNMDLEGYVDVSLLAGFNRVKNLTTDEALVREALLYSHILEVNGDKVRKREGWDFWLLSKQVNGRQTTDINIDIDHQNCANIA